VKRSRKQYSSGVSVATTINKYSVGLSLDASDYIEKSKISAREAAKLNRAIEAGRSPAENFSRGLDLLNKALEQGAIKLPTYNRLQDELAKKHKVGAYSAEELARSEQKAAEAAKRLKDETARLAAEEQKRQSIMDRGKQLTLSMQTAQERYSRSLLDYNRLLKSGAIDQVTYRRAVEQSKVALDNANRSMTAGTSSGSVMLGQLKALAAAYLGFQTITKSIKLATEVEDAQVAFEVLTGSVNDGKVLFQQIRDFAAASPITFSNAAQATRTMMSFGVEAQKVQENLRIMSDVTGGNNERFKMLSLAFSQMSAAGRLMGQDLLQMVNAGFNPLQQISKTTGESLLELKQRMEDGAISSDEVREAFIAATAEGGMFNGMTERLAATMGGKLNIALSDLEKAGASLGQTLSPLIISMTDGFNEHKSILNDMIWLVEKFTDGLGYAVAMVKDMADAARNMDFDAEWTATNKFLDALEKRDRERAAGKAEDAKEAFEQPAKQAEAAAKAADATQAAIDEEAKKRDALAKQQAKAAADRLKEIDRLKKAADDAFNKEVESAMEAAKKHFEIERDKRKAMRDAIAQGPTSMEAGSSDAAKFMADQVNARIAAVAMPGRKEPTEKEILSEAKKQFLEAQKQTAIQEEQKKALAAILENAKENGFRRVR
jgi:tape measure domain-containing protein